jgi:N6-L-threonylcarbamoyladenine synthase
VDGPRVLAIESSCDETACAVVEGHRVRSNVVASQVDIHGQFGGVVPEVASRHHLLAIVPVVREALARAGHDDPKDMDALAVTDGPGLVGALLVGLQMARGLAGATGLPLFGIHHMEGHLFSICLGDDEQEPAAFAPHVALLVSGGHSEFVRIDGLGDYRVLGATRDDAVGEAYDKVAKLLGLGYPGGPAIDQLATEGDPKAHVFPRAMAHQDNLDLSFSGLKTAVVVHLERSGAPRSRTELADVCASFQAAVVDVLVLKARRALRREAMDRLHVVGGVAANAGLRTAMRRAAEEDGFLLELPSPRYCGDNAAMIAAAAVARMRAGWLPSSELHASLRIDDQRVRRP